MTQSQEPGECKCYGEKLKTPLCKLECNCPCHSGKGERTIDKDTSARTITADFRNAPSLSQEPQPVEEWERKWAIAVIVALENKFFKGKYSSSALEGLEDIIAPVLKLMLSSNRERVRAGVEKLRSIHLQLSGEWTGIRLNGGQDRTNPHKEKVEVLDDVLRLLTTPQQ